MFPEIAKGIYHDVVSRDPFTAELVISCDQPFTPSLRQGDRIPLSYFDYIVSDPGPFGRILARGVEKTGENAKSSGAVVVYGTAGKGRYIANGSLPGLLADGSVVPPSSAEKMLLLDCVRYLAGLIDDPAPGGEDLGAEYDLGRNRPTCFLTVDLKRPMPPASRLRSRFTMPMLCCRILHYPRTTVMPVNIADVYQSVNSGLLENPSIRAR